MEYSKRRRQFLQTIGAGSVLGIAGCVGGDDGGSGDSGDSGAIRLGLLGAQSGELGEVGSPIIDAMQLAVDQVDGADNGVDVDVQVEDTETRPAVGAERAQNLLDAGYPMICGALSSAVSQRVAEEVAVPNEVLMCSPASTSPELSTFEDDRFFFRTAPADILQGQVLAYVAANRLLNQTAAVFHVDDTYGAGLAQSFVESFESEYDGTVTSTVAFESERPTYVSQLGSVLSGDPETLLVIGFPASGSQILTDINRSYSAQEFDVLVSDGLRSESLPEDVQGDLANVTGTSPGVGGPGLEFFNQRYEEEYGREPSVFTPHAYDAAATLMLSFARIQASEFEPEGENLRNAMWWNTDDEGPVVEPEGLPEGVETAAGGNSVSYRGVSGPVNFDARGDLSAAVYDYFEYTADGNITEIDQIEI